MRVTIPHMTETDADRIRADLEREPVRIPRRRNDDEPARQAGNPRRRHHTKEAHAA